MKIGLLLISTGKYHGFIQPLINSADKWFLNDKEVVYFLFTDSNDSYISNRKITKIYQRHMPWPMSTLMRYNMFTGAEQTIRGENIDYLFYCDIDMLFVNTVGDEILSNRVLTIHPGFQGGRGTPETNPNSLAYISPNENMTYFAGGFNGGSYTEFIKMAKKLNENIIIDYNKGIIAIWDDESHLNRYAIDNPPTKILDPGYCYPEQVDINYQKRLLALNKNHQALRT